MCRWLAYAGPPRFLDTLLFEPSHSLVEQSLDAWASSTSTNGDGFGLGWYGERAEPGIYKSIRPAWNDRNLRDLAGQIRSGLFLAHVRSATGSAVQRSNCHPFRRGSWLFQHNGEIRSFELLKRDLAFEVAPELFPQIEGSTDSELLFYLALSLGLRDDPVGALERAVGRVEARAAEHGVVDPVQMTLGLSDGQRLYALRYSSGGASCSLFASADLGTLGERAPWARHGCVGGRLVVSEPCGDLGEAWHAVPESSVLIVEGAEVRSLPFRPLSAAA